MDWSVTLVLNENRPLIPFQKSAGFSPQADASVTLNENRQSEPTPKTTGFRVYPNGSKVKYPSPPKMSYLASNRTPSLRSTIRPTAKTGTAEPSLAVMLESGVTKLICVGLA